MTPRFVFTTNGNASYTNSSNRGGDQYVFKFSLTQEVFPCPYFTGILPVREITLIGITAHS